MKLEIKDVFEKNFKDIDKVDRLNRAAFPDEERMDVEDLLDRKKIINVEFFAVYDNNEFIGFFNTMIFKNTAYVLFLAVEEDKRSRGYGSEILKLILEKYKDYQVILDLEVQDETAENAEQRKSRKAFYLRNGYVETGYVLEYGEVKLELLSNVNAKIEFNIDEYLELMICVTTDSFKPKISRK